MVAWAERLESVGPVTTFDYPYMAEGRKRPDRPAKLIAAHRSVVDRVRKETGTAPILVGKSMGGRMGCHVSLETEVRALVCLGYPLSNMGKVRDEVLRSLRTPVLFVQGTRDALCPLDLLDDVRRTMTAPSQLFVVEEGDHSLLVTKRRQKAEGISQGDVDDSILGAIRAFAAEWGASS